MTNKDCTRIKPEGFAGKILSENTKKWALEAFEKNPGITGHFAGAKNRLPAPGENERELMVWYNEFAGKLLCGLALNYEACRSDEIKKAGDALANSLSEVQAEDGYLGIYEDKEKRFGTYKENGDVWGHYHIVYGLYLWYKITGNEKALETAKKALDCVWEHFTGNGKSFDSATNQTMNLAISHAFAVLYKETKDKKYLDTAIQIVNDEWPLSGDWKNIVLSGKDFYQSPLPRWETLHTVMTLATLYEITGNKEYFDAFKKIWKSIQKTDRHNTGGFSSEEMAKGTPFDTSAIETCCTIAWMAMTTEYLRLSEDSSAADELELSFFNGMLASVMPGNREFTYNTPMENDRENYSCQIDIGFQHNRFSPDFNCCQANGLRGLYEIVRWAAYTSDDSVILNYYGPSLTGTLTPLGNKIGFSQKTEYPANGKITISVLCGNEENFTLKLRIPLWSENTKIFINGNEVPSVEAGKYLSVKRTWKNGDEIVLELDMSVHAWTGKEGFEGKASLYSGPILLTQDKTENNSESLNFSASDLKNIVSSDVSQNGVHNIKYVIPSEKGETVLYDFASCGKKGAYTSWLKFEGSEKLNLKYSDRAPDFCGKIK